MYLWLNISHIFIFFYFLDNDNFTNISLSYFFMILYSHETKKNYQNN